MAEIVDWGDLHDKYKGFCVALLEHRQAERVTVVATGKEFEEAQENAKKNGYPDAWVVVVPEIPTLFMGGGYEIPLSNLHVGPEVESYWLERKAAGYLD